MRGFHKGDINMKDEFNVLKDQINKKCSKNTLTLSLLDEIIDSCNEPVYIYTHPEGVRKAKYWRLKYL
jgi:hypothetical protein